MIKKLIEIAPEIEFFTKQQQGRVKRNIFFVANCLDKLNLFKKHDKFKNRIKQEKINLSLTRNHKITDEIKFAIALGKEEVIDKIIDFIKSRQGRQAELFHESYEIAVSSGAEMAMNKFVDYLSNITPLPKSRYHNDIELRRNLYHLIKNFTEINNLIKELEDNDGDSGKSDTKSTKKTTKNFRIIDLDDVVYNKENKENEIKVVDKTRTDHILDKYLFLIEIQKSNKNLVNKYYRTLFYIFTKSGVCTPYIQDNNISDTIDNSDANDAKFWYIDCEKERKSNVCIHGIINF